MMMKILLLVLFFLYRLLLELVYFLGYPLLWLILGVKHYREALKVGNCKPDILIHAASLGEINALSGLIKGIVGLGFKVAINTITVTGRERAKALFPDLDVALSPLDVPHLKQKQMSRQKPKLILIAETEIWPNMLYAAKKHRIPVLFINARVSARTLDSYMKILPLLKYISASVEKILTQSKADAQRFELLFPERVMCGGNLKFALELPDFDARKLRGEWGFDDADLILCWGSSRPGEENLLKSIYPDLKAKYPNLKVILAPRHPKRVKEIENILFGLDYVLLSKLKETRDILIVDSLGKLAEAYAICDIAIIGGSFFDFGGHNPLEPAYYAKPIIIGNYHASCRDSVSILQQSKGILVSFKETLAEDIAMLLDDKALSDDMGQAARKVLTENASALQNHIQEIEKCLN